MISEKKVSVVIPCFNEEKYIKNTINHVLDQDYPKHLVEIIAADGMSTDSTFDILEGKFTYRPVLLLFMEVFYK